MFLFRSFGSRCELEGLRRVQFGNPWHVLEELMARYELLEEIDLPFPLGGCFGYWGYDLKNFVEPGLPRTSLNDLELPDCLVGFYDSLAVFDHRLDKTWIISTGLRADGSRSAARAREQIDFWTQHLSSVPGPATVAEMAGAHVKSNLSREMFVAKAVRARDYIHAGDIYQINLCQRLTAPAPWSGWNFFERLSEVSPSPFPLLWMGEISRFAPPPRKCSCASMAWKFAPGPLKAPVPVPPIRLRTRA